MTSDFRGRLPGIRDIFCAQSVSFDRDSISRVKIRLEGGVVIEYVGIPQEENYGSTVAWTSISQTASRFRERLGDLTE